MSFELDENSPVPLYIQLANRLRADITNGTLKRGALIQSEKTLEKSYGVSRTTIRNALSILVEDGLLYRKRGKGTSVRHRKLTRQSPGLIGIHEEIRASGRMPETRLLNFAVIADIPADVKKVLDLKHGQKAVRIERAVLADSKLLGITIAFIPLSVWENVTCRPEQLENQSIYRLLEKSGFKPHEAEEIIEVTTASKELGKQLNVPKGFPLFSLKRTVYSKEGVPIESGENIFRSDRYAFKIHHWRPINL
jgi:GntR family transcriptional regulator